MHMDSKNGSGVRASASGFGTALEVCLLAAVPMAMGLALVAGFARRRCS